MSQSEKIKEEIGWLKVLFAIFFAADMSMIAYLFNNIEILSNGKITILMLGLILATLAIIFINKKAMKKIDSLGEL